MIPYNPIHLKYRPQTLAQLVGQDIIATTLSNAIKGSKIAPAYLFVGPRGTGKTSTARILAKSLNCQSVNQATTTPCGQCQSCRAIATSHSLDVNELDAASNSGVENIREIVERSSFAPVESRYKVIILDECHSLSQAAFNSLLKTLEQPSSNVVFVLCTTEVHKVPLTIISRCQRFDFKIIDTKTIAEHLQAIAVAEQIDITPEALQLVAQTSHGCLRDALTLLDQLSNVGMQIAAEQVYLMAGTVPEPELLNLLDNISTGNATACCRIIQKLVEQGKDPFIVYLDILRILKDLLVIKTCVDATELEWQATEKWERLLSLVQYWKAISIQDAIKLLNSSSRQMKQQSSQLWLEVTILELAKIPRSLAANNKPTADPWYSWEYPSDAIAWGHQLLPHLGYRELWEKWNALATINGKKAPAWVKAIEEARLNKQLTTVGKTTSSLR